MLKIHDLHKIGLENVTRMHSTSQTRILFNFRDNKILETKIEEKD